MERARSDLQARVLQYSPDENRPHLCAGRVNARWPLHRYAWVAELAPESHELPALDSALRRERVIPSVLSTQAVRASRNKDQARDTSCLLSGSKRERPH